MCVALCSAFASGYFFARTMEGLSGESLNFLVACGVFFSVSSVIFFISTYRFFKFTTVALETAVFLGGYAILIAVSPSLLLSTAAVIFIFTFFGNMVVEQDIENRLSVSFFAASRRKIGWMLTGYLLGGIMIASPLWSTSPLPIPENQFHALYGGAVKVAAVVTPQIQFNATVKDFAESIAKKELSGDPRFAMLPPDVQDKAVQDASVAMIAQAQKNLNLELSPQESVADVFYAYLKRVAASWKASFGSAFTLVSGLTLFILLRGIGVIMVGVSALIAMLLMELLVALGAISVIGEPATKERVVML